MSKGRLVVTAVTVEKRPVSEVAKSYGVARSWICTLLARYEAEGEAAFEPRSRRPETSPPAISDHAAGLDGHSRCVLPLTARARVTGPAVLQAFRAACERHGAPASTLTGNGMVFTTRLPGGPGGRSALEHEPRRPGVKQENGTPDHPRPRGKPNGSSRQ